MKFAAFSIAEMPAFMLQFSKDTCIAGRLAKLGAIIWYITIFGCALLFFGIGVYASKLSKPMWFWSGSSVDASKIADVAAYNKENARMWKIYSLWYWASGFAYIFSPLTAVILLLLGCSIGIVILVKTYLKITNKYARP